MLVELGGLARVPEALAAPRVWRGGLIATQGTPGKGVLGDQIIDAAKAVVLDHDFFALRQRGRAALRAIAFSLLLFESDALHRLDVDDVESDLLMERAAQKLTDLFPRRGGIFA